MTSLTAGELVWLHRLPNAGRNIDPVDGAILEALAASIDVDAELRLIMPRLEAWQAHTAARAEIDGVETALASAIATRDSIQSLRAPIPGLRADLAAARDAEDDEAIGPLETAITEREAAVAAAVASQATIPVLREQIGELLRRHGLDSTRYVGARFWGAPSDDGRTVAS